MDTPQQDLLLIQNKDIKQPSREQQSTVNSISQSELFSRVKKTKVNKKIFLGDKREIFKMFTGIDINSKILLTLNSYYNCTFFTPILEIGYFQQGKLQFFFSCSFLAIFFVRVSNFDFNQAKKFKEIFIFFNQHH